MRKMLSLLLIIGLLMPCLSAAEPVRFKHGTLRSHAEDPAEVNDGTISAIPVPDHTSQAGEIRKDNDSGVLNRDISSAVVLYAIYKQNLFANKVFAFGLGQPEPHSCSPSILWGMTVSALPRPGL